MTVAQPRWYAAWTAFVSAMRSQGIKGPLTLVIGEPERRKKPRKAKRGAK